MKELRVLMIGPGTPDSSNAGLGIYVEQLKNALAKKIKLVSIEPHDMGTKEQDDIQSTFVTEQVVRDLVKVSINKKIDPYSYYESTLEELTKSDRIVETAYVGYTKAVLDAANKFEFDIIYAHDWVGAKAAIKLKRLTSKPMVIHFHSLDSDRVGISHKSWVHDIEQEAVEQADAIIAVSHYTAEKIIAEYKVTSEKIAVIYPGNTLPAKERFSAKAFDPTILFLGRFEHQKAPIKFIEIAEKVIAKNNTVHFLMVGDGALKHQTIELVAKKKLGHRVHFAEFVTHNKVIEVYQRATILCVPSESEPFGLAAIEAAGLGIPVVISKQSGAKEVLTSAIVIDKDDLEGFTEAILSLISNASHLAKIARQEKKDVRQLSWDQTTESLVKIFNNLVI